MKDVPELGWTPEIGHVLANRYVVEFDGHEELKLICDALEAMSDLAHEDDLKASYSAAHENLKQMLLGYEVARAKVKTVGDMLGEDFVRQVMKA